jgi:hypothetical protein
MRLYECKTEQGRDLFPIIPDMRGDPGRERLLPAAGECVGYFQGNKACWIDSGIVHGAGGKNDLLPTGSGGKVTITQ